MLGIIVVLLLLIITGGIVLAYEIADIQKRIGFISEQVADVHTSTNKDSLDTLRQVLKVWVEIKTLQEQVDNISSQPKLSEDSDDFSKRIEDIKNELGLRVQIADAQKTTAPTLHPNVYNIEESDHAAYEIKQEVEYAR